MRSSTLVADRVPVSVISAMEDRKRAIPHDSSDDPSPPLKRQAVTPASSSTNHQLPQSQEDVIVSSVPALLDLLSNSSTDLSSLTLTNTMLIPPEKVFSAISLCNHDGDDELPILQTGLLTFTSLQHFQKEAIFRQMLEYKRERNLLENKVEQLDKKATYHDDHIRVMDAWWDQVRAISLRYGDMHRS